jgi:polyisoprenoid-binding protein YceI
MATAESLLTGTWETDANHSSFEAGARHMGVGSFKTRFEDVRVTLTDDERGPRLEGRAEVASISIRNPAEFREHVVNGADMFDAGNHPDIRFASDHIELGADGAVTLRGELTIKGITKPITATGNYREPIEDPYGLSRTAFDLTTTIDRRDFGLDWQMQLPGGGDVLGWDVTIEAHLEFIKA